MADETSPKDLIRVIKGNKGLTIVAIGAAILLLFYLYKQSQAVNAASTTATASPTAPTGFMPAMGSYTYVEDIHQTATPIIGPAGATGARGPQGPQGPASPPVIGKPIIKKPPVQVKKPIPAPSISSAGLLGTGIRFFPKYKNGLGYYRGPKTGGKIIPIPLPANTVYIPGADGRMYYQSPPGSPKKLLGS